MGNGLTQIEPGHINAKVYNAAVYLNDVCTGKKNIPEFKLQVLIDLLCLLGADYSSGKGSKIIFIIPKKGNITIHRKHKNLLKANSYEIKYASSPFRTRFRELLGYDFAELVRHISVNCYPEGKGG